MKVCGMKAMRRVGVMNVASFVISADREKWFLVARLCRPGARSRGLNTELMNCFYSNDLAWYCCILSSAGSLPGSRIKRGWHNTKLAVLEFRGLEVQIPPRARGILRPKATSSLVMPVRLSAWNSMKVDMSNIFRQSV
jgi:hypothetical protein